MILIIVVWIIAAIGFTRGLDAGRDEISSSYHYEREKKNALKSCIGVKRPAFVECVSVAIETAQEQSNSRQDLYAQQDMANYTFWMLIASVCTFGVTAIGVWYVKRTLDATLVAVSDTSSATSAMHESNRIMSEDSRPWVKFDFSVARTDSERPSVSILYQPCNIGKKPAFDVSFAGEIFSCDEFMSKNRDEQHQVITKVVENAAKFASLSKVIFPTERGLGLLTTEPVDTTKSLACFMLVCAVFYSDRHGGERKFTVQSAQIRVEPTVAGETLNGFFSDKMVRFRIEPGIFASAT